jgi:predicted PurR-regulated permease PerM
MLKKKSEKNKIRAQRVISFAPKQVRDILSKAFDTGVKQGVEAFKTSLPMEGRQALEKKLKSIKKPKTDSELEQLISAAQSEASNIQEQVKSLLGLFVDIGIILMVLMVLIIIIRGADGDIAGYCG